MRYSLVIPAYNEAVTIQRAVEASWRILCSLSSEAEIIVVDDGSGDETGARVEKLIPRFPADRLRLIRLSPNQGKGRAVRAGVLAARGELIGFLDADLASPPEAMIEGFRLLEEAPIAIASRRVLQAKIDVPQPWYRSLAGQAFNLMLRIWFGFPYRDTQCGCKFFQREAARRLFQELRTAGWAFDVELLWRACLLGYAVREFPVTWRNGQETRVRLRHAFRLFQELWAIKRRGS